MVYTMNSIKFSTVFLVTLIAYASPVLNSKDNTIHSLHPNRIEENFLRKLNVKCAQRDNHSCMMLKLITYMDRILKKSSIEISDNLKLIQTKDSDVTETVDDDLLLSRAMDSDNEVLGVMVAQKIWKFIKSRMLRYKLYDNADVVVNSGPDGKLNVGLSISPAAAIEEGRGRMRNMGVIMAAIAMKLGIVGAMLIKGLILLTGKALLVSKIALVISVLIGLRKLLNRRHVTYEVVAHPHHSHDSTHAHDSYSSGWGRALDGFLDGFSDVPSKLLDVHDMVYGSQKPEEPQT